MTKPYIQNARTLLRQSEVGVLATHSKKHQDYPFGSVSTFMGTHEGNIIFYVSDLAQHTKNIAHNPKMSFTVFSEANHQTLEDNDPNAGARLCVMGEATLVEDDALIKKRYFSLFPSSAKYQAMHDFAFYQLSAQHIRYIGGFGDIHWIEQSGWLQSPPEWEENEEYVINHMNDDHADSVQLIYQHHTGKPSEHAKLLAAYPDGCFIKNENEKGMYVPFEETALSSQAIRQGFVSLSQKAKQALS